MRKRTKNAIMAMKMIAVFRPDHVDDSLAASGVTGLLAMTASLLLMTLLSFNHHLFFMGAVVNRKNLLEMLVIRMLCPISKPAPSILFETRDRTGIRG